MSMSEGVAVPVICIGWLLVSTLCAASEPRGSGADEGYIFAGPREVKRRKQIKKDIHIVAYHQRGVFVSNDPQSPWYQAALFIQGTAIEDAEGNTLQDLALCETTDADGDLNWSILWRPPEKTNTIAFKLGTGKWEGITGQGRGVALSYLVVRQRARHIRVHRGNREMARDHRCRRNARHAAATQR